LKLLIAMQAHSQYLYSTQASLVYLFCP